MAKCAGLRALHMPRSKNAFGPFFQSFGPSCIKGTGNFYAPGMPGSGPQAIRGVVEANGVTISISWTQCVQDGNACATPRGMTVTRLPSEDLPITAVFYVDEGKRIVVQVGPTIEAGDEIVWSYDDSGGCIESCDGEPIGDQGPINVDNPLVLAGDFILTEEGGSSIILVEEDIDETDGINTEEAP